MNPLQSGVLLALAAAISFGVTTPLVQYFSVGLGSFSTASLLYLGAASLSFLLLPRQSTEARIGLAQGGRIFWVALCGAVLAPVLLAIGLRTSSATTSSLLLNLEAVLTVILGALIHKEVIGQRIWGAVALIAGGGMVLVMREATESLSLSWGVWCIVGATFFWALDNTLSRPLSSFEPGSVVAAKGSLGGLSALSIALLSQEPLPSPKAALGLFICGAIGYGGSLKLYLRAQRSLGSARTGSVFAVAPFVGALVALLMGAPLGGWATILGGSLMMIGLYLHLTEPEAAT